MVEMMEKEDLRMRGTEESTVEIPISSEQAPRQVGAGCACAQMLIRRSRGDVEIPIFHRSLSRASGTGCGYAAMLR
ncbi:MAG: hypothetical protein D6818_06245 [Bacteroidetes bacterium]|nr:MAG: hypothetical protein D6818_06245 [Bacteroidota bacterium]